MKNVLKISIFALMILCSAMVYSQTADNTDQILQKINEALSQGDCDHAQKRYNVWKDFTQTTDTAIESRIAECVKAKEGKEKVKISAFQRGKELTIPSIVKTDSATVTNDSLSTPVKKQLKNESFSQTSTSDGKNWFIGAGVRGNVWANKNGSNLIKVWQKPALGGELFVGKWFSHVVGLRLFADGGTIHPFFYPQPGLAMTHMEDIQYISGRLDFMLNLTNLFRSNKTDRFYNLIPYIGPGYYHTLSIKNTVNGGNADAENSLVVGGGLLNTFRLSHNMSLYVNLGVDMMDAGIDGSRGDKFLVAPSKYYGLFAGSLGLIYKF